MKRSLSILVFTLLAASVFAEATAVLSGLKGKVEVKPLGKEWVAAKDGMRIDLLATISTGFDSQATLTINENKIAVAPLTRLTVDKILEQAGKLGTSLHLRVGKVSAEVKSSSGVAQDFKVTSPYSTASVRGTLFTYDGFALDVEQGTVAFVPGKPKREIVGTPAARRKTAAAEADDEEDKPAATEEEKAAAEEEKDAATEEEKTDGRQADPEKEAVANPDDYGLADFLAALEAEFPDDNFDVLDDTGAIMETPAPPVPIEEKNLPGPSADRGGKDEKENEEEVEEETAEEETQPEMPAEPLDTEETPAVPEPTPTQVPIFVGSGTSAEIQVDYSTPTPPTDGGRPTPTQGSSVTQTNSSGISTTTTTSTTGGTATPTPAPAPTPDPVVTPTPVPVAPKTGKIKLIWRR